MMDRRRFLLSSLAGALAVPLAGEAQQAPPSMRRVAYLTNPPRTAVTDSFWAEFAEALRGHGWVPTRNLLIERREVEARTEAIEAAVEDLVRDGVEVIVVSTTQAALAAKRATGTVPIVMTVPADPVAVGLVDSLARPGGNVTGLSFVGTEIAGKQVELLKETVRNLTAVGVLVNPMNASHALRTKEISAVARALAIRVDVLEAQSRDTLVAAFRGMTKRKVSAAIVLADHFFVRQASMIIALAAEHRLPAMYGLREAPLAGGLISYGPSFRDMFRRAALYVDKILRGAKPSELPIEQATRFELVINVKTAKALNLTIPPSLLARADQVIE